MAIKKLRLSFDVPIAELLALVATRNDALHIDVVGDGKPDKPSKLLSNAVAGLLEGPATGRGGHSKKFRAKDEHGPMTTYQAAAIFLMKAPDHTGRMADMKAALVVFGVNPVSISPAMTTMRKDGNAKQLEPGTYKLTAQGVRNFEKLIREREGAQK